MTNLEDMMAREIYLGDGLFASFDGWQVKLRAPRPGGDDVCYLDPGTLASFLEYIKRVEKACADARAAPGKGTTNSG